MRGQILSQLSVKDEPLWASANARMKLDQQVVKVHLTLPLSNEPLQLWKHDIVNRATAPDFVRDSCKYITHRLMTRDFPVFFSLPLLSDGA